MYGNRDIAEQIFGEKMMIGRRFFQKVEVRSNMVDKNQLVKYDTAKDGPLQVDNNVVPMLPGPEELIPVEGLTAT